MKLRVVLFSFFILIAGKFIKAQEYHLGLQFGFVQSSLESGGTSAFELKKRQAFGIALTHNVRFDQSPLGFSIGSGYLLKGTRIEDPGLDYRFHYMNFPVLLDFFAGEKLKLSIGPEFAFLADARNRLTSETSESLNQIYNNRWEISGTVSLSYALDFFADIGAKYNQGFSKVSALDPTLNITEVQNSYLKIFLAFKIAN